MKSFSIFFVLISLLATGKILAQTAIKSAPFVVSEGLTYDVKFSKAIFRGIGVGEFRFKVLAMPETSANATKPSYRFSGEAISKGSLIKLFRQNISINLESQVDAKDFAATRSTKFDQQNSRIRNSVSTFDYTQNKLFFTETDPTRPTNPPRMISASIDGTTHDIVSAIYALRLLPLAVGKSFELAVSDTGVIYKIPVKVVAREQIKTEIGKFWAFRIVPEIFGERGLVQGKGDMTIWITDDNRRIPLRSRINADIGRIEVRIKTAENLIPLKN